MKSLSRRALLIVGVIVALLVLIVEFIMFAPVVLERWKAYDYWQYIQMGEAVRRGESPFGSGRFYPLPTILWIFVPLSLLPDWFRIVWVLAPFAFLLVLFRSQAFPLFGFMPLWFVVGDGMLDGWLLLPLAWLLQNRKMWAGLGAAVLLFKPQLAILAVLYAFAHWPATRDWRNLGVFATAMTIFYAPSFVVNPNWVAQMLAVLPDRAAQTTVMPSMAVSVWAWKELGILGLLIVGAFLLAILVFSWRIWRRSENRAAMFQLLGLLLNPVLFASNYVMTLPVLRGQKQVLVAVILSWLAFGLDQALSGFGGGYALVPLAALYWLSRDSVLEETG